MALAVSFLLAAVLDPQIPPLLERVSEEAGLFVANCQKVVGTETLTQKGRVAPPRFRLRSGVKASEAPAVTYRTTELVSDYTFGLLRELGDEVKEIRVVISVNGRPVRERGKARLELSEGMRSDRDRLTRRMLQEMEGYGLVGAATDLGQMLMLFHRSRLDEFEFTLLPDAMLEGESVAVLAYQQNKNGALVFHREVSRLPLSGQLWVRRGTNQPARITAEIPLKEGKSEVLHRISVDYAPSRHGLLLPSQATYTRMQDSVPMVETRSVYTDFKMFSTNAEITFEVDGDSGH